MTPWQRYEITLDHFVVAANNLADGEAWLAERLGVPLQAGGRHEGVGTHNKLLQLGGGTYLELIAADPGQPDPTLVGPDGKSQRRARPFGLDRPDTQKQLKARPRLVHFVMRTTALDDALAAIDYDAGQVVSMQRGTLSWRLAIRPDGLPQLRGDKAATPKGQIVGVLPTLIDWGTAPHPGQTLEHRGVTFQGLSITAPTPELVRIGGIARDPRIQLHQGAQAGLAIELQTPLGWTLID